MSVPTPRNPIALREHLPFIAILVLRTSRSRGTIYRAPTKPCIEPNLKPLYKARSHHLKHVRRPVTVQTIRNVMLQVQTRHWPLIQITTV